MSLSSPSPVTADPQAACPRRVFLFGASSIVGCSFVGALPNLSAFCNNHTRLPPGLGWRRINLQDQPAVRALFARESPDLILHCAGICNVAKCQESPEFAHLVNVQSMEILLAHVPRHARIVYLSSDHVFSGESGPYTESSPPDPISVYGRTRVLAERLLLSHRPDALVVRAGLWIGPSYNRRLGHLDWLRSRRARGLPMTIIADEYRSALWARDAVARVLALADSDIAGIRHVVADRIVSRPQLAAYLNQRYAIGASFAIRSRCDLNKPHIGYMDLRTEYRGPLATPIPSVISDAAASASPLSPHQGAQHER